MTAEEYSRGFADGFEDGFKSGVDGAISYCLRLVEYVRDGKWTIDEIARFLADVCKRGSD